jgi:hypothetical protein
MEEFKRRASLESVPIVPTFLPARSRCSDSLEENCLEVGNAPNLRQRGTAPWSSRRDEEPPMVWFASSIFDKSSPTPILEVCRSHGGIGLNVLSQV